MTAWRSNSGNPKAFPATMSNAWNWDEDGTLWIGTYGAGLNR